MAQGDVYQIRVFQTYIAEQMVNTFYYQEGAGSGGSANDLYSVFDTDVWDLVRDLQNSGCVTNRFTVVNGSNNLDQVDSSVSLAGLDTNTTRLPAFIAAGFRSQRPRIGSQYAYKRIGGLVNTILSNGVWATATVTKMNGIALAFGTTLEGSDAAYVPVILTGGFRLNTVPTVAHDVAQPWLYNTIPTKQDTRQVYNWNLSSV